MNTSKIIDDLGGTSVVAEMCEIKPASVSEWRKNGIPDARLMYLKLLRPDVFANQSTQQPPEAAEPACHE